VSSEIPGLSRRREAREEALTALYQADLLSISVDDSLIERHVPADSYANDICGGVAAHIDELDELLGRHLQQWSVSRMPIIDRALARMAVWEIKFSPSTPTGVVLSEAVELASNYCGERSPQFLNGVLSAIADEVRS